MCPATDLLSSQWEPKGFALVHAKPVKTEFGKQNLRRMRMLKVRRIRFELANKLEAINISVRAGKLGLPSNSTVTQIQEFIISKALEAGLPQDVNYETAYALGTSKTKVSERETDAPLTRHRRSGRAKANLPFVEQKINIKPEEENPKIIKNGSAKIVLSGHSSILLEGIRNSDVDSEVNLAQQRIAEVLSMETGENVSFGIRNQ